MNKLPNRSRTESNTRQSSAGGVTGWGCPYPAGAGSFTYAGSVREVEVEPVSELAAQGGTGSQGWSRETPAHGSDRAAVAKASPRQGRGGGGWGRRAGGVDVGVAVNLPGASSLRDC